MGIVCLIIVLLILAGISIATLAGDNGVLTKASDSKILNEIGKVKDEINLKATEGISDYYESVYLNGTNTSTHSLTELAKMVTTKLANTFSKGNKTGTPNSDYADYTIAIKGDGIGATITIQSKAVSSLKAIGTMDTDGKIVWNDEFKRTAQGPDGTGTYTIGQEITFGNEPFFVIKDNGDSVKLLAKYCLNYEGTSQETSYEPHFSKFSNTCYWFDWDDDERVDHGSLQSNEMISLAEQDGNVDTGIPNAVLMAINYGNSKGVTGRLMNANELEDFCNSEMSERAWGLFLRICG